MKKYGMYQGRWLYSCTFDEMLKAHIEKTLNPAIIYVITDRSKVGTKFLCYKGMMVGTLVSVGENEEKILFYDTNLCVPFEIWAAKELDAYRDDNSNEAKATKVISERPTIESMCKKEEEIPEIELNISDLAQSLLDSVSGC